LELHDISSELFSPGIGISRGTVLLFQVIELYVVPRQQLDLLQIEVVDDDGFVSWLFDCWEVQPPKAMLGSKKRRLTMSGRGKQESGAAVH